MKIQAVIREDEHIEIIGSEPDKSIKIVGYEKIPFNDRICKYYEYWTVECDISITIKNILLFDKYNKVYYADGIMEGKNREGRNIKVVDCWAPLEKKGGNDE